MYIMLPSKVFHGTFWWDRKTAVAVLLEAETAAVGQQGWLMGRLTGSHRSD